MSLTITDKDIAWLWLSLTKAFGYKFLKNFGEQDNGVWLEALKDLKREDLEYGFKRVIRLVTQEEREKYEAWPPNVKEFRMYCERRFEDFGLPRAHVAFAEAQNNERITNEFWTHPLVRVAAFQLKKKTMGSIDDENYPNFKKIYSALCYRFMRGEALCLPTLSCSIKPTLEGLI